jgi:tetratricopeptide (TPR) repeat protein
VFLMLTLIAWQRYVRRPGAGRYLAAAGLLACGLMAKPMLVSVPFLLLLLDVWPLARFESLTTNARFENLARLVRLAAEKLPLVALAAASAAVTFVVQRSGAAVKSLEQYPLGERLANAVLAWTGYVGKLVRPVDLAFFYPYRREFPAIEVGLAVAALIGVSAAAILLRRRWPYVLTGWFWYWGMLVPVIGIVQVGGQSMADRYLYVPAIGLFVVAVWGGADIAARLPRGRAVLGALGLLVVLALIPLTRAQTRTWKDGATLYRHALAVTENNHVVLDLLGVELLRRGELDAAIARFEGALAVAPDYAPAHNNLGVALAGQGRYRDAIPQYRAALTASPDYGEARNNLGIALASVGEVDAALEQFEAARRLDPDDPEVLRNLGIAWSMKGDTARSLEALRAALDRRPDWNDVALKVARILATDPDPALRDGPEAVRLAEHACSAEGGRNAGCLDTLAAAYAEAGRWDDAVRVIERAIELAEGGETRVPPARLRELLARYRERQPLREGGAGDF